MNARDVTNSLSIMGCTGVRGRGLEALRGSRKLEQIDLRRSRQEMETLGETGLDDQFVVDVLSSMAPINADLASGEDSGLKLVKIRRQHEGDTFYEAFSDLISDFLFELNHAIANQVRDKRETCRFCECVLPDNIPEDEFGYMAPTCYCSKCRGYSCAQPGCYANEDCEICMDQFCHECREANTCDVCYHSFCSDCKEMRRCERCIEEHRYFFSGAYCLECKDIGHCM